MLVKDVWNLLSREITQAKTGDGRRLATGYIANYQEVPEARN